MKMNCNSPLFIQAKLYFRNLTQANSSSTPEWEAEFQSSLRASEPQIHFVTCQPASCGFGCPWTAILRAVTNDSYHYRLRKSQRKKTNHRRSAKPRNSSQSKSLDESLELWGDIMKEAVWKWRGVITLAKYINTLIKGLQIQAAWLSWTAMDTICGPFVCYSSHILSKIQNADIRRLVLSMVTHILMHL